MLEILELMEAARNCVAETAGIESSDKVVIWTDNSGKVDPQVIVALSAAVQERGAKAIVIYDDPPAFRLGGEISPVVEAAFERADIVFQVLQLENAASVDNPSVFRCLFEYKAAFLAVICPTVELMQSDWAKYPPKLARAILRSAASQVKEADFLLRDENGTHLTGRLKAWPIDKIDSPKSKLPPGFWGFFPLGTIALHPESPLNGTVVFETMEGFSGYLSEPVRLTVEDHWVTKVEGGPEAKWLQDIMSKYENANYFCELAWGIHPKASLSAGLEERAQDTILYRRAGVFHCAVGLWPGVGVPCKFHWDGGGIRPTLYIGDQLVIDKGRLTVLDSPDLIEIAKEFGNPNDLLSEAL